VRQAICYLSSAPYFWKSSLRISAFLCDSAVIAFYSTFTAETQRNAEIRRVHIRALPLHVCFPNEIRQTFLPRSQGQQPDGGR